jgi:hypothetical protein
MGMSISSSTATAASDSVSRWQERKQAGKDLAAALKSGDLQAAQTAYATMTKDGTGKRASQADSPMARLGDALNAGDMAAAQKVAEGMVLRHHHRNHGGNGAGGGTAPQPLPQPSPPTAVTGNHLNVVA